MNGDGLDAVETVELDGAGMNGVAPPLLERSVDKTGKPMATFAQTTDTTPKPLSVRSIPKFAKFIIYRRKSLCIHGDPHDIGASTASPASRCEEG